MLNKKDQLVDMIKKNYIPPSEIKSKLENILAQHMSFNKRQSQLNRRGPSRRSPVRLSFVRSTRRSPVRPVRSTRRSPVRLSFVRSTRRSPVRPTRRSPVRPTRRSPVRPVRPSRRSPVRS